MNATHLFGLLDLVLTCVGHHDYEVKIPWRAFGKFWSYLFIFTVLRLRKLLLDFGTSYLKIFITQTTMTVPLSLNRTLSGLLVPYAATVKWSLIT